MEKLYDLYLHEKQGKFTDVFCFYARGGGRGGEDEFVPRVVFDRTFIPTIKDMYYAYVIVHLLQVISISSCHLFMSLLTYWNNHFSGAHDPDMHAIVCKICRTAFSLICEIIWLPNLVMWLIFNQDHGLSGFLLKTAMTDFRRTQ